MPAKRPVRLLSLAIFVIFSLPMFAQVTTTTLPVGVDPAFAAVNPNTNTVYVANTLCATNPCTSPGSVSVIDGASNTVTHTIPVGIQPIFVVVNPATNQIYVANECGNDPSCQSPGTVTVINGSTFATTTVTVGYIPFQLAINPVTNNVYVSNMCLGPGYPQNCTACTTGVPGIVTVINGNTLGTQNVQLGCAPFGVAVNPSTNMIYAASLYNIWGEGEGAVTQINGSTLATQTVNTGYFTYFVAVDPITNLVYATNFCGNDPSCQSGGTVTAIDGATLQTETVPVGYRPVGITVNPNTSNVYVANECRDTTCSSGPAFTVFNEVTLSPTTLNVCSAGAEALYVEVNSTTNTIYFPCNQNGGSVLAIDGATNSIFPIAVGDGPTSAGINSTTNTVYVTNSVDNTVSVVGGATKLQFVAVPPCRLLDTRPPNGSGPIPGGTSQSFALPQLAQNQGCANLSSAAAYSLNVTVLPADILHYLTIWPSPQVQPTISLMNSLDGRVKANATTLQAGVNGAVSVYVTDTANVLIDIDGYYAPATQSTLQFYPLTPCRVVDTRGATGDLGGPFLAGSQERDFPVLESSCIPHGINAQAYSFNVTAVPHPQGQRLGYLTVWPQGQPQPGVSTLNNPTGTNVANAAIVEATGTDGGVAVFPNDNTDLLIDINGYFAAPASGLSLYPTPPCRVLDTRQGNGAFRGTLVVPVETSQCPQPGVAEAYVLNATVIPQPSLGYLTLWAHGQTQPGVSTLNAGDGSITSNMAIVPTSDGSIDAYASALTQLLLDISSFFAP